MKKLEAHSDVAFAVVLLTADDTVLVEEGKTPLKRARQNAIPECGYFIAKLTRRSVVALLEGDVELPSDIHGIVWEPYDPHGAWQSKLVRELKGGRLFDRCREPPEVTREFSLARVDRLE